MSFDIEQIKLPYRYRRKLKKCLEKKAQSNRLWNEHIQPILNPELNWYVPLHQFKMDTFSDEIARQTAADLVNGHDPQPGLAFFSNPLLTPKFGPGFPVGDDRCADQWEPPKQRPAHGYIWCFTLECDPNDPNGLIEQVDWVWGPEHLLERFHQFLKQSFRDYRGLVVVWSGNKSLHLHFIFDLTHLSQRVAEVWAKENGKSAEAKLRNWQGDLNQDALWLYHRTKWLDLVQSFREVTGVQAEFDEALSWLFQKRRLPWGTRLILDDENNAHAFPPDTEVPQIVLYENLLRTSAKGAEGWFLTAEEGNTHTAPSTASSRSDRAVIISDDEAEALRPALTEYLRQEWSRDYPKPAAIRTIGGQVVVNFYNHPGDQHPSTIVTEGYRRILYRGQNAPTDPEVQFLPGGETVDELLAALAVQEASGSPGQHIGAPKTRPRGRRSIYHEKGSFSERLMKAQRRDLDGIRRGMGVILPREVRNTNYLVVKSVEGPGKSFIIKNDAYEWRIDKAVEKPDWEEDSDEWGSEPGLNHPKAGFTVFASASYKQKDDHQQEFMAEHRKAAFSDAAGVGLVSLTKLYELQCDARGTPKKDRITERTLAEHGLESLHDAIRELDPEAYEAITRQKNEAWVDRTRKPRFMPPDEAGNRPDHISLFNPYRSVIFTSHAMAQRFNTISKAKAWLHPDFHPDMPGEEWRKLASEFQAFHIIHDEVRPSDLVCTATEAEYQWAEKVRRSISNWDGAGIGERYDAYIRHEPTMPMGMTFARTQEVIEANFTTDDEMTVSWALVPFGRDRDDEGIYRAWDGARMYLKERGWWRDQRARVTWLTTEELPTRIIEKLRWSPDGDDSLEYRAKVLRLDSEEVFPVDHVDLIRDRRASARHVQDVAEVLLEQDDVDRVITDIAKGSGIISHLAARGSNELKHLNLATILLFLSPRVYADLNVIAQRYGLLGLEGGIPEVIHWHYKDMLNQAVGRNRGLRRDDLDPRSHLVVMSPNLYNELGGQAFCQSGRYRLNLVAA